MADFVFSLNLDSGQVGVVPAHYVDVFPTLVEVPEGTKSYEQALYKPMTRDEWDAKKAKAAEKADTKSDTKSEGK